MTINNTMKVFFLDFAVGAPYEGNGAVYIYHGSKDGVVKTYAQVGLQYDFHL